MILSDSKFWEILRLYLTDLLIIFENRSLCHISSQARSPVQAALTIDYFCGSGDESFTNFKISSSRPQVFCK